MNTLLDNKEYIKSLVFDLETLRDNLRNDADKELLRDATDYLNEVLYRFETGELTLTFKEDNNEN